MIDFIHWVITLSLFVVVSLDHAEIAKLKGKK